MQGMLPVKGASPEGAGGPGPMSKRKRVGSIYNGIAPTLFVIGHGLDARAESIARWA